VKRYNFFLPEDLMAALRAEADSSGTTISEIIRKVLTIYAAKVAERRAANEQ
jgi:hypothetical protein